jgi:hypothetical protein
MDLEPRRSNRIRLLLTASFFVGAMLALKDDRTRSALTRMAGSPAGLLRLLLRPDVWPTKWLGAVFMRHRLLRYTVGLASVGALIALVRLARSLYYHTWAAVPVPLEEYPLEHPTNTTGAQDDELINMRERGRADSQVDTNDVALASEAAAGEVMTAATPGNATAAAQSLRITAPPLQPEVVSSFQAERAITAGGVPITAPASAGARSVAGNYGKTSARALDSAGQSQPPHHGALTHDTSVAALLNSIASATSPARAHEILRFLRMMRHTIQGIDTAAILSLYQKLERLRVPKGTVIFKDG